MPNVLLLINEEAHIRELARVADLLLGTGDLRPVVFIEDRMKHLGAPALFVERGVEVLNSEGFTGGDGRAALGVQGRAERRLRARFITETVPALAGRVSSHTIRRMMRALDKTDLEYVDINRDVMLRRAAVCQAVLSQRPYSAVVMSEDNVELDTAVWIAIARRLGVRSVIVPYTISNTAEFAESYVHHAPYQVKATPQNKLVARVFSEWSLRYKGQHFLRSTFAKAIAVELLGLTPPNPWLLNSGHVDAIAVESEAMHRYYRAAGIPDRQLVTTGSLTDDVIAGVLENVAQGRRSILEEFRLRDDRPLLLCGLPPDQNTYNRPGCEFTDFNDLIGYWGDCLAEVEGWNVIVRPHPKTAPDRLDALRQRGAKISYADTAVLIPLCDLYVAAVSATIRWAIACGKPVINYDVYQYGYRDYEGVQGVRLVNTRNEFRETLQALTTTPDQLAALAAAQQRDAWRWGCLDGKSGQRIAALLRGDRLAASALLAGASPAAKGSGQVAGAT